MYNMYTDCKSILPAARLVHKRYSGTNIMLACPDRCKEMINKGTKRQKKKKGSNDNGDEPIPRLRKAMNAK
jgi:hypothetical protein